MEVYNTQKTCDAGLTLVYCWVNVVDGGQAVNQRWVNVSCMMGITTHPKNGIKQ